MTGAERVVEVGEPGRRAGVLHLAELEVAAVDAPLREVADLDVRLVSAVRLCRGGRGGHGDRGDGRDGDEAAGQSAHEPSRGENELKKVS